MTKDFKRIWISLVFEATIGAPGGLRQAGPEGPWGACPSGSGHLDGAKGGHLGAAERQPLATPSPATSTR